MHRFVLAGLFLLAACQRGPQYCIFDGTWVGAAPQPFVALNPDLSVDDRPNKYAWQEFTWPTDPAWTHVRPDRGGWVFEGKTGGAPWSFRGTFSGDGGDAFVRLETTGSPPAVQVVGSKGKPTLLLYRVRPCREFEGSKSGVRTCTRLGVRGQCADEAHLRVTVARHGRRVRPPGRNEVSGTASGHRVGRRLRAARSRAPGWD